MGLEAGDGTSLPGLSRPLVLTSNRRLCLFVAYFSCGLPLFPVAAQLIIEACREFGVGCCLEAGSAALVTHCEGQQTQFYEDQLGSEHRGRKFNVYAERWRFYIPLL